MAIPGHPAEHLVGLGDPPVRDHPVPKGAAPEHSLQGLLALP